MTVLQSIHHPHGRSRVAVYAEWLVRPLAMCILPLMIVTLVDVLRGADVMRYLVVGYPVAVALASAWTAYRMRTAPAEVAIDGPYAELRTVNDLFRGVKPRPWRLVLDVRRTDDHLHVAIGESVFELVRADWPEWSRLQGALRAARHYSDDPETQAGEVPALDAET